VSFLLGAMVESCFVAVRWLVERYRVDGFGLVSGGVAVRLSRSIGSCKGAGGQAGAGDLRRSAVGRLPGGAQARGPARNSLRAPAVRCGQTVSPSMRTKRAHARDHKPSAPAAPPHAHPNLPTRAFADAASGLRHEDTRVRRRWRWVAEQGRNAPSSRNSNATRAAGGMRQGLRVERRGGEHGHKRSSGPLVPCERPVLGPARPARRGFMGARAARFVD